jgi:sugar lactone lactonase YvrE
MTEAEPQIVAEVGFAEGLRWRDGALWYADIARGQVARIVPGSAPEIVLEGLNTPSGLGWTEDGRLLIVSIRGSALLAHTGGDAVVDWIDLSQYGAWNPNDMVTAPGVSYVGFLGHEYEEGEERSGVWERTGGILRVDHADGRCSIAASGLVFPNGMAISPDGQSLYVADTYTRELLRYDRGPDGTLGTAERIAQLEAQLDGIALDAEGCVWAGILGDVSAFWRIAPDGSVRERHEVPGWHTVACALGGADGTTLFMAVAQIASTEELLAGMARGRLLAVDAPAPAAATPRW